MADLGFEASTRISTTTWPRTPSSANIDLAMPKRCMPSAEVDGKKRPLVGGRVTPDEIRMIMRDNARVLVQTQRAMATA